MYLNSDPTLSPGGSPTYTVGPQATLSGPMHIYDGGYGATLVNDGMVNGSSSVTEGLVIENAAFINAGLAEATGGGTLSINGDPLEQRRRDDPCRCRQHREPRRDVLDGGPGNQRLRLGQST